MVPVDCFGAADDLQTFRVTRIVPDTMQAGKARKDSVQLAHDCQQGNGKLDDQAGVLPDGLNGMQVAGPDEGDIVFVQLPGCEVDLCLVPVAPADQQFHVRVPVDGVEILVVYLAGDIDLGAAVKNKILIVAVDA